MATKPITNIGTSAFHPVSRAARRGAGVERRCIHVSSGMTTARNRLRVSLVTVATRSTMSSAVHLAIGQRRADHLRRVVNRGAEKQSDRFRSLQQRMGEIRVREHAEQPERHDVGDRVGDLALVGVDGRRRRDDRRDAADARAGGDERAEPRRQPEPAIEPRHEDQIRSRSPRSPPAVRRRPAAARRTRSGECRPG